MRDSFLVRDISFKSHLYQREMRSTNYDDFMGHPFYLGPCRCHRSYEVIQIVPRITRVFFEYIVPSTLPGAIEAERFDLILIDQGINISAYKIHANDEIGHSYNKQSKIWLCNMLALTSSKNQAQSGKLTLQLARWYTVRRLPGFSAA